MNTDTITECMTLSFADTPFPQVVQKLVGAGVKSYTADLVKLRNTYYGSGDEAYDDALPLKDGTAIAPAFDAAAVAATVKSILGCPLYIGNRCNNCQAGRVMMRSLFVTSKIASRTARSAVSNKSTFSQ